MKRIFIVLLLLFLPLGVLGQAVRPGGSGVAVEHRQSADCVNETGGQTGEQCHNTPTNTLYVCEVGPCSDTNAWTVYSTQVDSEASLESAIGEDVVIVGTDDITSANLATILTNESGSGFAAFTDSPVFTTLITMPFAADPTTDANGEFAIDQDAWGGLRDAIEVFDGTASTYIVATLASDTPNDGEVPTYQSASGTILWTAATGIASFAVDADDNDPRTVTNGEEVEFFGGAGIDTDTEAAVDRINFVFDETELGDLIWGDGTEASLDYTFNISGTTDPIIRHTDNIVEIDANLQVDDGKALRMMEPDGAGANYVEFVAPATIASNRTCTLEDDGTPLDGCISATPTQQDAVDCTDNNGVLGEYCQDTSTNTLYVCENNPCSGSGWFVYGAGTGDSWGDPVDAVITPDADGTRDLAATLTRFATAYVDNLDVTSNIVVGGTVDGRDVAADGTELDSFDNDLATISVPPSTTISAFGATLVDDADAATARTTLGAGQMTTFTANGDGGTPQGIINSDTLDIAGGNGVITTAGATDTITVDIDLNATIDGVGSTTNLSGMEFTATSELALLQGCADNQILKWDNGSATWNCEDDAGTPGAASFLDQSGGTNNLDLRYLDTTASYYINDGATAGANTLEVAEGPLADGFELYVKDIDGDGNIEFGEVEDTIALCPQTGAGCTVILPRGTIVEGGDSTLDVRYPDGCTEDVDCDKIQGLTIKGQGSGNIFGSALRCGTTIQGSTAEGTIMKVLSPRGFTLSDVCFDANDASDVALDIVCDVGNCGHMQVERVTISNFDNAGNGDDDAVAIHYRPNDANIEFVTHRAVHILHSHSAGMHGPRVGIYCAAATTAGANQGQESDILPSQGDSDLICDQFQIYDSNIQYHDGDAMAFGVHVERGNLAIYDTFLGVNDTADPLTGAGGVHKDSAAIKFEGGSGSSQGEKFHFANITIEANSGQGILIGSDYDNDGDVNDTDSECIEVDNPYFCCSGANEGTCDEISLFGNIVGSEVAVSRDTDVTGGANNENGVSLRHFAGGSVSYLGSRFGSNNEGGQTPTNPTFTVLSPNKEVVIEGGPTPNSVINFSLNGNNTRTYFRDLTSCNHITTNSAGQAACDGGDVNVSGNDWTFGTGADPADVGDIRLDDLDTICWEDTATDTEVCLSATDPETLTVDGLNILHQESLDSDAELDVIFPTSTGGGDIVRENGPTITGGLTVTGGLSTDTLSVAASIVPTDEYRDSNNDVEDVNVEVKVDCTTTTDTNEDCDYWIDVMEAGGVGDTLGGTSPDGNTRFFIDADGPTYIGNDYVYIGDSDTPATPGVASADGDLFVEDALEVDGAADFASTVTAAGVLTGLVGGSTETGTTHSPGTSGVMGQAYYYSNVGVVTVTLPAVTAGYSACFYDTDGTAILTIEIDGSDVIVLDGTALTAGNTIDSAGAAGDFVCLHGADATNWYVWGKSGTWVDGGAT